VTPAVTREHVVTAVAAVIRGARASRAAASSQALKRRTRASASAPTMTRYLNLRNRQRPDAEPQHRQVTRTYIQDPQIAFSNFNDGSA
jgi:hypothetical protein